MLSVDAGGFVCIIYFSLAVISTFSLSLEDGSLQTEIMSQRAAKSKETNQTKTCT